MKKRSYFYLTLMMGCLLFVSASSCKKDDGLPKASQNGADIMAAKVNGMVWKATPCWSCISGGSGLSASYTPSKEEDYQFIIRGEENNNHTNIYMAFSVILTSGKTVYTLDDNKIINSARVYNGESDQTYRTSPTSTGTVTFTKIDTVNKIISGTFSFKAQNEDDPNDIINVTDGRFDVKYEDY